MEKHTPEPWQSFQSDTEFFHVVDLATQTVLADLVPRGMGAAGNAARIVASVNACEGIPTEALTPGSVKALVDACQIALNHINYAGPDALMLDGTPAEEFARGKLTAALAPFEGAQEVKP